MTLKQGSTQTGFRAAGSVAATAAGHRSLSLGRFRRWDRVPKSALGMVARAETAARSIPFPGPCRWSRSGREQEGQTRLSEFHLTKDRGLSLEWVYGTQADTTMTVGYSNSATKDFTAGGTFISTNTLGAGSGFTMKNRAIIKYIDGQAYWQRYHSNSSLACDQAKRYKNTLDHVAGSSFLGPRHPKPNPYGGCLNDPNGQVTLVPGETFDSDRGQDVRNHHHARCADPLQRPHLTHEDQQASRAPPRPSPARAPWPHLPAQTEPQRCSRD